MSALVKFFERTRAVPEQAQKPEGELKSGNGHRVSILTSMKGKWKETSKTKKGLIIGGGVLAVIVIAAAIMGGIAASGHFPQLQHAWNQNIKPFFTETIGPGMAQHANILIPVAAGVGGTALGAGVVLVIKHLQNRKEKPYIVTLEAPTYIVTLEAPNNDEESWGE